MSLHIKIENTQQVEYKTSADEDLCYQHYNSYPPFHGIRDNTLFSEDMRCVAPCVPSSSSGCGQCPALLLIFPNLDNVTGIYPLCRYTKESLSLFAPKSVRQMIKDFKNGSVVHLDASGNNEAAAVAALDFALFHLSHMSHCCIPYTVGQQINCPDIYLVGSFYSFVSAAAASGVINHN